MASESELSNTRTMCEAAYETGQKSPKGVVIEIGDLRHMVILAKSRDATEHEELRVLLEKLERQHSAELKRELIES
jgi:hypothetical protein